MKGEYRGENTGGKQRNGDAGRMMEGEKECNKERLRRECAWREQGG